TPERHGSATLACNSCEKSVSRLTIGSDLASFRRAPEPLGSGDERRKQGRSAVDSGTSGMALDPFRTPVLGSATVSRRRRAADTQIAPSGPGPAQAGSI